MDGPGASGGGPAGVLGITRRPTRREWRRALTLFAVGVVGLTLALLFIRPKPNLLAVGSAAPAVGLDAAGGGHVEPATVAGSRPWVLEFFETSCDHCQQAAAQLCTEGVPVFAVDAAKESTKAILAFRASYAHCGYPMLLDPSLSATRVYGVTAVPTVYVISNGRIAYGGAGLDGVAGLAAAIRAAQGG